MHEICCRFVQPFIAFLFFYCSDTDDEVVDFDQDLWLDTDNLSNLIFNLSNTINSRQNPKKKS